METKMPPPPTPATARPRISTSMLGATAQRRLPISKMTMSTMMTHFVGAIVKTWPCPSINPASVRKSAWYEDKKTRSSCRVILTCRRDPGDLGKSVELGYDLGESGSDHCLVERHEKRGQKQRAGGHMSVRQMYSDQSPTRTPQPASGLAYTFLPGRRRRRPEALHHLSQLCRPRRRCPSCTLSERCPRQS
jgi:hypothetical protein